MFCVTTCLLNLVLKSNRWLTLSTTASVCSPLTSAGTVDAIHSPAHSVTVRHSATIAKILNALNPFLSFSSIISLPSIEYHVKSERLLQGEPSVISNHAHAVPL